MRLHRTAMPAGFDACPCWLRSLSAIELLTTKIGAPPPARTFHQEYVELHFAGARLSFPDHTVNPIPREDFEPGGALDFQKCLVLADWKEAVRFGWPVEDAQLLAHIAGEEGAWTSRWRSTFLTLALALALSIALALALALHEARSSL